MKNLCLLALLLALSAGAGCKSGGGGGAVAASPSEDYIQLTTTCEELHPPVAGCGFCEIWARVKPTDNTKVQYFTGESGGVTLNAQADCMAGTNVDFETGEGQDAIYWKTLTPAVETRFTVEKNAYALAHPDNIWVYAEEGNF